MARSSLAQEYSFTSNWTRPYSLNTTLYAEPSHPGDGRSQVHHAASLQAVANVARALKPGSGRVLVRDYAEGDLAQLRLDGPTRRQRISENFFARSDGTQAYYFTQVLLQTIHLALCHSW